MELVLFEIEFVYVLEIDKLNSECRLLRSIKIDGLLSKIWSMQNTSCPSVVDHPEYTIARYVNVLIIHCSEGSDFRIISSNEQSGLEHLYDLNTAWLKGYDEKADYVADLKKHIGKLKRKPVSKFEKLKSA